MNCLMLKLDKTLFKRTSFNPMKFLLQYGVLSMMSYQITKKYFCRDVKQTFHDMNENIQFVVEQYHWGMELMTHDNKANCLGEFLEK
ncbi:unnamed protein product [Paramecium primaurelia]|uniref:Uncharacterized protein n=1 Tax=Paramecium primaurelia TaxID=5886 RepID=A0A8S1LRW2_PARPR|nr:unnamed protein product [Paramecium primaurelia]